MYQGGFIWDYMDQALWQNTPRGRNLGYGGDFGDRQTDYAFSGDGIVFANGVEKPAMQEVRYWYAPAAQRERQERANLDAIRRVTPLPRRKTAPLTITHGDGALGVRGKDFEVLFSYSEGGPCSIRSQGQEWLWRAPRPSYWRAPTENDIGNGFAAGSALWSAAERWQTCSSVEILSQSEQAVSIRYGYESAAVPGPLAQLTYTLDNTGALEVRGQYFGAENRPELLLFGIRFSTPAPVERVRWLGLSGETYPDRKKGGVFGWNEEAPGIPDYLVPQECGNHMDTHQTQLFLGGKTLILEKVQTPYAFSAIPYTPWQLSEAAHGWELPQPCRTTLTLCGAMRGVGGINSWGADVEEAFRLSARRDYTLAFRMLL